MQYRILLYDDVDIVFFLQKFYILKDQCFKDINWKWEIFDSIL